MPGALHLQGPLDVAALRRAIRALEERQEVLRTRFLELPEGPQQVLLPAAEPALEPRQVGESELAATLLELAARPFDLFEEKPWRVELLELGPDEHVLFYNVHHIAFDGISLGIFERELAAFYGAEKSGAARGPARRSP